MGFRWWGGRGGRGAGSSRRGEARSCCPAVGAVRVRDRPAEHRRLVGIETVQVIEPVVIHFGPAETDVGVGRDRQVIAAERAVYLGAAVTERTEGEAETRLPIFARIIIDVARDGLFFPPAVGCACLGGTT